MVIRTVAVAVTITTTTAKTLQSFLRYTKRFALLRTFCTSGISEIITLAVHVYGKATAS